MGDVLLVTDADWLFDEVSAALCHGETRVGRLADGRAVAEAVDALKPELVILDMQNGSMGGIAACLHLRHEAGAGRIPATRVLLLLDRDADRWIAREADADGWMIKPVDPFRLRKAHGQIVNGHSWYEGEPITA